MEKSKVLFISQEMSPYVNSENYISKVSNELPQAMYEKGWEIRTFMPRYGCINERRHQLHEVIRLSGLNIIVNDSDQPLIIKVASIPASRIQVYFIDNDEYFDRKFILNDENNEFFKDNDERSIFFCKGVIEIVKKLGWAPDIVHCHGWMSGLIPYYIKTAFKDEPTFSNSKIVYSTYNTDQFKGELNKNYAAKANINGNIDGLELLANPSYLNVLKNAIRYSDGIITTENLENMEAVQAIQNADIPSLILSNDDEYVDKIHNFYQELLVKEELLAD